MPIVNGSISYAPFPEGWQGDMDEAFQQSGQLATLYLEGNVMPGMYYPIGTTPPPVLPTSDQGPVAMNGVWYFWNPTTGQYQAQSSSVKVAKNFAKNCVYQVQQTGTTFTLTTAATNTYDMVVSRAPLANVLGVTLDTGPVASSLNDYCPNAIKYTVGSTLAPSLGVTDLYAHEHLIEGADINMIQGEVLTVTLWVYTSVPGTYSVYLMSGGRDASYVSNFAVPTANSWTQVIVNNVPALPTGTGTWTFSEGTTGLRVGVVMAVGAQYQTANLNKWQAGLYAGSAQNLNFCTVTGNLIKITGIKVESAANPTYLSVPSWEADLHDVIRYYWTSFNYQALNAGVAIPAIAYLANSVLFEYPFPRRMCKAPSVVPYGWSTFASGKVTNISTSTDYTAATLTAVAKGINYATTSVTATKGDLFAAYVSADARLT